MDILLSVMSKTLNLTNEQLSEMLYTSDENGEKKLKDDAIDVLINADAERVAKLKEAKKDHLDNFHKKGYSEALQKLESDFVERTGHKSEKKGLDLFIEYAEIQKNAKTKLSDDEFKLDKRYLDSERVWKTKVDEEVGKVKNDYESKLQGYEKQVKQTKLISEVDKYLPGNIKWPENEKAKANQKQAFLSVIQSNYDFDFSEDGNHIVKKGESRLEDKHGNLVAFPDFVKNISSEYFDFVEEQRQTTGNNQQKTVNSVKPKDEKDYLEQLKLVAGDREKEIALYKLYKGI
jgi:hypothetical protein